MGNNMQQVFSKIFMWLCLGLIITFATGYFIQTNTDLFSSLYKGSTYLFVWLAEIVVAIVLVVRIRKLKPLTTTILYLAYTILTGVTFATIFVIYNLTSIIYIFAVTALVLFIFGMIGYKTKIDLTRISTFLFMGIIAIIILMVVSAFIDSVALNLGVIIFSLILFFIYVAYDIQMIKRRMYQIDNEDNLAIYGAFQLYIDFINIFMDLLSLFGKEK